MDSQYIVKFGFLLCINSFSVNHTACEQNISYDDFSDTSRHKISNLKILRSTNNYYKYTICLTTTSVV